MVMLSTPPPNATSTPSFMMWWAAMAMACRPDEQKRLTVVPATVTGRPARPAAPRAMLWPCAPCGWPQPRMTSSTSLASSWGTLPRASLMAWAARSSGRVRLNEPRCDLARGVRELATTTASLMGVPRSGEFGRVYPTPADRSGPASADSRPASGPERLAELPLEDLARARAGQLRGERDRARDLVGGQVAARKGDNVGSGERGAGPGDDHGVDALSPLVAGDAEHRHVDDVRMALQRALDLRRVDVHPAGDDHVRLAVADVVEALRVAIGHVAHRDEPVALRRAELAIRFVVADDRPGRAHEHLARHVGRRDLAAVVVVQANLHAGHGATTRI